MDLGSLPPEVTSALLYAGPGSGPMVAAASAWNGLAAELNAAAVAYEAQIVQLSSEEWLGPASASMAEAASPYVTWMSSTSALAEQAAGQATAAAAAYETAVAAIVPPPLIAENRALLAHALMTNVFGQNTNAIAQLEAQYSEMWAHDSAVMYQYAASAGNATAGVTPFASPPQVANPAAAAAQAAATPAESVSDTLNNLVNQINAQLAALANPATDPLAQWFNLLGLPTLSSTTSNFETFPANSILGSIANGLGGSNVVNPAWFVGVFRNFAGPAYNIEGLPYFSTGMANTLLALNKGLAPAAAAAGGAAHGLAGLGEMMGGAGGPAAVTAGLGEAASVGKLSVPAAISGFAPAATHAAPLPVSAISAAPEGAGAGNLLGGMPLAGVGSGAAAAGPKYGFRPTVMTRPPFAG